MESFHLFTMIFILKVQIMDIRETLVEYSIQDELNYV